MKKDKITIQFQAIDNEKEMEHVADLFLKDDRLNQEEKLLVIKSLFIFFEKLTTIMKTEVSEQKVDQLKELKETSLDLH